jgi:hypothetical protein
MRPDERVGRADDQNIKVLPAFVAYFYNEAPSQCWGSKEKMESWLYGNDRLCQLEEQAAEARRRLTRARYLP